MRNIRTAFLACALLAVFMAAASPSFAWERSLIFTTLGPSSVGRMTFNNSEIPLTSVEIYPYGTYTNVVLNVSSDDEISGTLDEDLAFFRASLSLGNAWINRTVFTFRVENDAITEGNLKKGGIYLARYDDKWVTLRTVQVRDEGGYTYFRAESDRLGIFSIAAKNWDTVELGSYKDAVLAGKSLLVPVRITNGGSEARDFSVSLIAMGNLVAWQVEGMGVNTPGNFNIKAKETREVFVSIVTNADSMPGRQDFEVVAKGDETTVRQGSFFIQSAGISQQKAEVQIEKQFEEISSGENTIKIVLTNNNNFAERYFISLENANDWADYDVSPSNIAFLEPGSTQISYLKLSPKPNLESMAREFTVAVRNDEAILKSESFESFVESPLVDTSKTQDFGRQLIAFAAILLVVIFIVYPVIKSAKKKNAR